jgi:hypothetical protein
VGVMRAVSFHVVSQSAGLLENVLIKGINEELDCITCNQPSAPTPTPAAPLRAQVKQAAKHRDVIACWALCAAGDDMGAVFDDNLDDDLDDLDADLYKWSQELPGDP